MPVAIPSVEYTNEQSWQRLLFLWSKILVGTMYVKGSEFYNMLEGNKRYRKA